MKLELKEAYFRCTEKFKTDFFKLATLTGSVRVRNSRSGGKVISKKGISRFLNTVAENGYILLKSDNKQAQQISSAIVNFNNNVTQLFHIAKNDAVSVSKERILLSDLTSKYHKLNLPHIDFLSQLRTRPLQSCIQKNAPEFDDLLAALTEEADASPKTTRLHFDLTSQAYETFQGDGKGGVTTRDKVLNFLRDKPRMSLRFSLSESEAERLEQLLNHYEHLNAAVRELNRLILVDRENGVTGNGSYNPVEFAKKIVKLTKEIEALK